MGLYLQRKDGITIRKGDKIALYGRHYTSEDIPPNADETYLIQLSNGLWSHPGEVGVEGTIGRFANMLIPEDILALLVFNVTVTPTMWDIANGCARAQNAEFKTFCKHVFIVAKEDMDLSQRDVEVFVDYIFQEHFFPEVFKNPEVFLRNSPMLATAVIFAICDARSVLRLEQKMALTKNRYQPETHKKLMDSPHYLILSIYFFKIPIAEIT